MNYGPKLPLSEEVGATKHRMDGETFTAAMTRQASALADNQEHFNALFDIYANQRFLNAGRVQKAVGSGLDVTAFNCFVSGTIPDSMAGIFDRLKEAALTMQMGGGIGYDFSTIRPNGAKVKGVNSDASGPLSFMAVFDKMCLTIMSAGARRGAMMGVMRVDHPDIYEFINAKTNGTEFRNFNLSVGVTDEFMEAVWNDTSFALRFEGTVHKHVRARDLWEQIMLNTWDWAEPGVLFIDRINNENNLFYVEKIAATNPCAEQPLPPYGACLLGSLNWAAYVVKSADGTCSIDTAQMKRDIPHIVRALDNVVDRTKFPLDAQRREAQVKRRIGIGPTGVANALEAIGLSYATPAFLRAAEVIQRMVTTECYKASVELAKEKGAFPLFNREQYLDSEFIKKLPHDLRAGIHRYGIRNSHLTSVAPTGSISLAADNISSGIEPPYALSFTRKVRHGDGVTRDEKVEDYGLRVFGVHGRTADDLTPAEHISVLAAFQKWIDSSCSKTCNIGPEVTFEEFKQVYMDAYQSGAKGCTTFRAAGKLMGIFSAPEPEEAEEGAACRIDPETGQRTCD